MNNMILQSFIVVAIVCLLALFSVSSSFSVYDKALNSVSDYKSLYNNLIDEVEDISGSSFSENVYVVIKRLESSQK